MFQFICIIFSDSYPSILLKLQKSLRLQTQCNQQIKTLTYVIIIIDDKIQSIKCCELCQLFLITVHGRC